MGLGTADDPSDVPPEVNGPGTDNATDALKFIGSVSAAGAEDFDNNGVASRRYVWGMDMSGADFLEALGEDAGEGSYVVVAFAVNSDGVAISAVTEAAVPVEK